MNFTTINELIFCYFESIFMLVMYLNLTGNKVFTREALTKYFTFSVMYTGLSYFSTIYLPGGYQTIVISLFVIILFSFIMKINIFNSLFINIIIFLVIFVIETIVALSLLKITGLTFSTLFENTQVRLINSIVGKTIELAFAFTIFFIPKQIIKIDVFKKDTSKLSMLFLQTFLLSIFIFSLKFVVSSNDSIYTYLLLISIIFFAYIVLAYFDFKERDRLLIIENRLQSELNHIKNLEGLINIIRREKHDFLNHINTIFALCTLNKPDSLEKIGGYIRKLSANLSSSYRLYNSGNAYLDGLLAIKSNTCFENDIEFRVNIKNLLSETDIDELDATTIMGNILNNAIEAIQSVERKEGSYIEVNQYIENNSFIIDIINNGPSIPKSNLQNIFQNGFTTKEKSSDRGYGLYIIQQCIRRNNGKISVSSSENKTEFKLEFVLGGVINNNLVSETYNRNATI
jgi:two-component system sensor histidine kinase AgrC